MALKKQSIKDIEGVSPLYENVDLMVKAPTRWHFIEQVVAIGPPLFFMVLPFIITIFTIYTVLDMEYKARERSRPFYSMMGLEPEARPLSSTTYFISALLVGISFFLSYKYLVIPLARWFISNARYSIDPGKALADPRRPALLLRSFMPERVTKNFLEAGALREGLRRTPEEGLVRVIGLVGPVITVGLPGEDGVPLPGATRIYLENESWDQNVLKLIKVANLVVIDAGISESLKWEMLCVRNMMHPRRVLVSFLNRQDTLDHKAGTLIDKRGFERFYERFAGPFLHSFNVALPQYDSGIVFIQFDDNWNPYSISIRSGTKVAPAILSQQLSLFFSNLKALNDRTNNQSI